MKFLVSFFLVVLPLMCSNNASKEYNDNVLEETIYESDILIEEVSAKTNDFGGIINSEDVEQKLIKESYLKFETQDLNKTYKSIIKFIKQNNGYVQNDNTNKSYNSISRSLEIRVPANNFQTTIDSITNVVDFFDSKRISSRDVTEEFIDIEARLKAKKTLETRYLELLSKAKNVKEILEIERELSTIREEIEAKTGRLKYLTNKVSLSTIDIEFYKTTTESKVTRSYGSKMWKAIASGFSGLSLFFLGLLNIWPFILLICIGIYFLRRWLKRSQKKS